MGEAYNAGESIEVLMALYGAGTDTILNHLARFSMAGNPLRTAKYLISLSKLMPDQQQNIFHVADELGSDVLKPVQEDVKKCTPSLARRASPFRICIPLTTKDTPVNKTIIL